MGPLEKSKNLQKWDPSLLASKNPQLITPLIGLFSPQLLIYKAICRGDISPVEPRKKTYDIPLYWLFNRDL